MKKQQQQNIEIANSVVEAVEQMLTAEQIEAIKDVVGRTMEATNAEQINAGDVLELMAQIAKLHRRITKPASETIVTIREDGTKLVGSVTTIKCEKCGKDHMVKVQDAHQVKRCPDCQKIFRNAKRAENRKAKRTEIRAQKEADAAIAAELLAKFKAEQAEQSQDAKAE